MIMDFFHIGKPVNVQILRDPDTPIVISFTAIAHKSIFRQ